MSNTHRSCDRALEKTPEQVFINSLRKVFELSPAASGVSQALLMPRTLGKLRYLCASVKAKHSKPLSEPEMIRVELTLDGGVEDFDVLRTQGTRALRQSEEHAPDRRKLYRQYGLMTQEYNCDTVSLRILVIL